MTMLLKLAEICERYLGGAKPTSASTFKGKYPGFPPVQPGKRYDVKAVLEFYVEHLPHTYKIWREAKKSLDKWDAPSEPQDSTATEQHEGQAPDYETQLEQLRWACVSSFNRWQALDANPDADGVAVAHALKSYTTTQETLRRAEMDNVELQKKRGEVLLTADVQAAVARLIGNTLQKLMQLPQLLAPQLKGLSSQARIKKILEDEIRKVVNGLQRRPF